LHLTQLFHSTHCLSTFHPITTKKQDDAFTESPTGIVLDFCFRTVKIDKKQSSSKSAGTHQQQDKNVSEQSQHQQHTTSMSSMIPGSRWNKEVNRYAPSEEEGTCKLVLLVRNKSDRSTDSQPPKVVTKEQTNDKWSSFFGDFGQECCECRRGDKLQVESISVSFHNMLFFSFFSTLIVHYSMYCCCTSCSCCTMYYQAFPAALERGTKKVNF